MITKYLLERAIEMLPIASKDPTRTHTTGVHILSKNGSVTLTATDGHMLLTRDFNDVQCPSGEFMLRRETLPVLKGILKDSKHTDLLDADLDSEGGLLVYGASSKARIGKMVDKYPDYKAIIPKEYDAKVAITLDAEFILAIASALTDGNKRATASARIVFNPTQPLKPIFIEREGMSGFTALVMPLRDAGSQAIADKHSADMIVRAARKA